MLYHVIQCHRKDWSPPPPPPPIATTTPSFNESQPRNCQEERKRSDLELMETIRFLEEGTLPDDDKRAHVLVLNKPQHTMVEKGLYHIALDKTPQIVLPLGDRNETVLQSAWWAPVRCKGAWHPQTALA